MDDDDDDDDVPLKRSISITMIRAFRVINNFDACSVVDRHCAVTIKANMAKPGVWDKVTGGVPLFLWGGAHKVRVK